jgi:hypothetical protein
MVAPDAATGVAVLDVGADAYVAEAGQAEQASAVYDAAAVVDVFASDDAAPAITSDAVPDFAPDAFVADAWTAPDMRPAVDTSPASCDPFGTACPTSQQCSYTAAAFACTPLGTSYAGCATSDDCAINGMSCLPLHSTPTIMMCLYLCKLSAGDCSPGLPCWPLGDAAPGVGYCSH